jgi:hypothetical protein
MPGFSGRVAGGSHRPAEALQQHTQRVEPAHVFIAPDAGHSGAKQGGQGQHINDVHSVPP